MLDADESCFSRRFLKLELEAGLLPPPAAVLPLAAPPSPAVRALALPPVVFWVMPLHGSPAPIGYIYDATPDPNGGLLVAASAFFFYQGHQVVNDPCPDLTAYRRDLGGLEPSSPLTASPTTFCCRVWN